MREFNCFTSHAVPFEDAVAYRVLFSQLGISYTGIDQNYCK